MPGLGLGLRVGKRRGVFESVPLLAPLSLSSSSIAEDAALNDVVGAIVGATVGSTVELFDTAGNRFAKSGNNIVRGATALDFETATSHNITIRETLVGYDNSPRDTVIAITVNDVVESAGITPPTLTETNAANDPVDFSMAVDDTVAVGMYWELQLATDAGFTGYDGGAVRSSGFVQIQLGDIGSADLPAEFDTLLQNQVQGNNYARVRVSPLGYPEDPDISDWSNVVSENVITLTPSTFDPAAKGANVTLSNGNLTMQNAAVNANAHQSALSTNSRSGKKYFRVQVGGTLGANTDWGIGIDGSDLTLGYGGGRTTGDFFIRASGGAYVNGTLSGTGVFTQLVSGDWFMLCFDEPNGKVWAGKNGTWNGDPAAGTGGFSLPTPLRAAYHAFGSVVILNNPNIMTLTADFDDTTWLPSGFESFI